MRFAFLLMLLMSTAVANAADHTKESLPTVKRQLDDGKAVLVDVREKSEWDDGHIDGAIFFPLSAINDGVSKQELTRLPQDKVLYVHCVVGKRALTAGNVFEKHGYTIKVLKPGYREMVAAGFPKAEE